MFPLLDLIDDSQPSAPLTETGTLTDAGSVQIVLNAVSADDARTFTESAVADPQNVYSLSFTNGANGSTYSQTGSDTLAYTTSGTGASITYNAGNAFDGTYGAQVVTASTGKAAVTGTASQNGSTHYARFYVRFGLGPGGSIAVATAFSSGGTVLQQIKMQSVGTLQLINGTGTQVGVTSTNVANGGWYRVEWDMVGATQTLRLYKGSYATPIETISGAASGTSIDTVGYGNPVTTAIASYTYQIDEIAGNSGRTPGPISGGVFIVEDFENGSNGSAPSSSNDGTFTAFATNGLTFSSTQKYLNSLALKRTTYNGNGYTSWTLPGSLTTLYARWYFYVTTVPSTGTLTIAEACASPSAALMNAVVFSQDTASTFVIGLKSQPQGITNQSAPYLSINTWYRVEWEIDAGATTHVLRVYLGEATSPLLTVSQGSSNNSFATFLLGNSNGTSAATYSAYWDAAKVSSTTQPGAIAPATSAAETGAFTESATVVQLLAASETGAATDAASARTATLTASETASAADAGALLLTRSDSDTATAVDAKSSLVVTRPDADTVTLVDAGGVTARNGNFFDGDTATFTELTATDRPQNADELGTATDSSSLLAQPQRSESVGLTEREAVVKATWRFTPPTRPHLYQIKERTSLIITINDGLTVLKNNGTYRVVSDPLAEDVESADIAYLGGRAYAVDDTELAALTAAGYGAYLALVPEPS